MTNEATAHVDRLDIGPVAVLQLNAPATRNALTAAMMARIAAELAQVQADDALTAAVITGAGEHFAAGGDIRELRATAPAAFLTGERPPAWDRIAQFAKPLVAAVRGAALGGGWELALTCDAVIVGDDASLGLPEVTLGLLPGAGGAQRLTRSVGRYRAAEVVLAGERLSAWEAHRLHLVSRVVPREQVVEAAVDYAGRLGTGAPLATRFAKRALRLAEELPLSRAIEQERALASVLLSSDDFQEAVGAYLEKRPARFTGR